MTDENAKIICPCCGAVSYVVNENDDEWLECIPPEGFEWKLPAGKITPIVGDTLYISATGEHYTREEYLTKFIVDPEIAYTKMRGTINNTTTVSLGKTTTKPVIVLGKAGQK